MQQAMFLASIFGPFLMIMGIWKLFYHGNVVKVATSVKNTPGIMNICGVINLLLGLTIVNQYNVWMWNLALLLTLLGWFFLLRGLLFYFMPQCLHHKKLSTAACIKVKGVIALVWGFGLCCLAFWM